MQEADEAVRKAEEKISKANIMALNGPCISQSTAKKQWFRPSVDKKSKKKRMLFNLKKSYFSIFINLIIFY